MLSINNLALNTSSLGYTLGYKKNHIYKKNSKPFKITQLIINLRKLGFAGIEFPYYRFYSNDRNLEKIKKSLKKENLFCIIDSEKVLDLKDLYKLVHVAKKLNSNIIRIKASEILSAERWKKRSWRLYIEKVILKLKKIKKLLKKNKLKIAIENHQDFDSYELLYIVKKVGKDVIGINFDIGNALATCEEPIDFAKRIYPYIVNVHIKDYKIGKSKNGILLSRCWIGSGYVDMRKILYFLKKNCPNITYSLELGALDPREILGKKKHFWKTFKHNIINKKFFYSNMEKVSVKLKDTPWQKKLNKTKIINYEKSEIKKSLNYLKKFL
tara:strand:+ start:1613 stop:2590 length:978 start_codon:yes stop_codon:yes gene_type:complete